MKTQKYLILGSSGQIGSALTNYLREQKQKVLEFDIVRDEQEDLRISKNKLLQKKIKEADFIYFLAFDVGGSRYLSKYQDSYDFISNNLMIMVNVFGELKRQGKPFIFASSQMSTMYHSTYGLLKAIGERYTTSLEGLSVCFWNVYGLETNKDKAHVITDFVNMALKNKKIKMITDGQEKRQMLFAKDCSECLFKLSKKYKQIPKNRPLHVSSFKWIKIIEIAKIIANIVGEVKVMPGKSKDSIQQNVIRAPEKDVLNYWRPNTSLQTGISEVIFTMSKGKHGAKINK